MSANPCPQCGESNNPEAKFCRRCGGSLAPKPESPSYGAPQPPSWDAPQQPPAYGEPPRPPSYGEPQRGPSYGEPPQQPWGAPQPPSFGDPQRPWAPSEPPPAYDPSQQPWGAPQQPFGGPPAYGQGYGSAPGYGSSFGGAASPQAAEAQKNARNALIMGIVGLFCFGVVLGPLAIIFGVKARGALQAAGASQGQGMATGAIVLGVVDVLLWIAVMVLNFALM